MKKKLIALLVAGTMIATPVYIHADEKDDRIAELEAQVADLQKQLEEALAKIPVSTNQEEYKIGETWVVENAFKVTIDSVEETQDRNSYTETNPAAVYIVTYTYENIGLENELYLSLDISTRIIDSKGKMGYSYPGDIVYYPQPAPAGATCEAQACIGVDNAGPFSLIINQYDNEYTEHSATFSLDIE